MLRVSIIRLLKTSPPLAGGEKGEGEKNSFIHPSPSQRLSEPAATLTLPRRRGRGITGKIKTIFG